MKKWLAVSLAAVLWIAPLRTEAAINIADVSTTSSHYAGVSYLNKQHAFDYMGKRFHANGHATRAEVAEVLYRMYHQTLKPVRTYKGFTDVTSSHPHYAAIKWSYEVGVFDGSGNVYNANSNIRRDQLAKVLVSAFQLKKTGKTMTFHDVGNDSFTDSIYTLASLGITTGDKGNFKPREFVTNSQLASFIYRLAGNKTSASTAATSQATTSATSYVSEYGFAWQIATEGVNLRLKGMDGTKQVAQYTTAKGDNIGGIVVGSSTKKSVNQAYPKKVAAIVRGNMQYQFNEPNEYAVVEVGDQYVYVFYDLHANNVVRALFAVNKQYEMNKNGFFGTQSAQSMKHYDQLTYAMINQARLAQKVAPLNISAQNEAVAYNHSKDMYSNNYFSHTNLRGQTPMGRYTQSGYGNFYGVGENIAMGQFNAIFAFEGLHNSSGHRQNLLNPSWTHMAVSSYAGTAADMQKGSTPYFTQLFFK